MIRAILFDINGTLSNIWTNEQNEHLYRTVANFLGYHGVSLHPETLKNDFFELNKKQRHDSKEQYPEFDVIKIFQKIISRYQKEKNSSLTAKQKTDLAETASVVFRSASLFYLDTYPNVKRTLRHLKKNYRLAAISDGQEIWAKPEINMVGLNDFFEEIIVSSHYGYRKPDSRLFLKTLKKMDISPEEAVYVGNDMFRDIFGARQIGMKTVFFNSNQGQRNHTETQADYEIYDFSQLTEAMFFFQHHHKKERR